MLMALSIRDIVLIGKLDLTFHPGLTVLTGETGAGKSIILDSLGLALGFRGDGGLVRHGAPSGTVTAAFDLPSDHGLHAVLCEHGLEDADGGLILRRQQMADGRSKAFVNDRPVSAQLLRHIGSSLVEIHCQHDSRALLDQATHRNLLDTFGGLRADVEEVGRLWRAWRGAQRDAAELADQLAAARRDIDYLQASCDDLSELAPRPGEEEELAAKRRSLMARAKVRADLEAAAEALSAPTFPEAKLSAILRRLDQPAFNRNRQTTEHEPALDESLRPIVSGIERVLIEAHEALSLIEAELQGQGTDDLDAIEERLFKLRALARKHRVPVDGLAHLHQELAQRLDRITHADEELEAARKRERAAWGAYEEAAGALSRKRRAAGEALASAVQKGLKPLRLEKAKFSVEILTAEGKEDGETGGAAGKDSVTFCVKTNPGTRAGPLAKVASGGELARFLLALKVVLAQKNTAPVLIFDEIDTGVGGATASAIGERLADLSSKAQVLAVTHSPQVAAFADRHLRLYKSAAGSGEDIAVETRAEVLDDVGRREEIARMLAGHKVTDEARAAAARLIGGRHEGR